jgi:hypothetical protein
MKKLILTVALFTAVNVNAQIEVKETVKSERVWQVSKLSVVPSIDRYVIGQDTSYALFFKDAQYTQITSIESIGFNNKEDLMSFVKICKDVIATGESVSISLNNEDIFIAKSGWMAYVKLENGALMYLTEKQLNSIAF